MTNYLRFCASSTGGQEASEADQSQGFFHCKHKLGIAGSVRGAKTTGIREHKWRGGLQMSKDREFSFVMICFGRVYR